MPASLYFNLFTLLRCGDYDALLQPYLRHFPREK